MSDVFEGAEENFIDPAPKTMPNRYTRRAFFKHYRADLKAKRRDTRMVVHNGRTTEVRTKSS